MSGPSRVIAVCRLINNEDYWLLGYYWGLDVVRLETVERGVITVPTSSILWLQRVGEAAGEQGELT